jgi:threonine/homoserine/homoserine lactone efflux protein
MMAYIVFCPPTPHLENSPMLGVTDYGAFVIAFLILLAIPGPGNFALITATGKGGIKGGLAATFGVILGDQVLMWLAVAGVATLLAAYPAAFHVVQRPAPPTWPGSVCAWC